MRYKLAYKILIILLSTTATLACAQENLTIHGYAPQVKDGTPIYLIPSYPRRFSKKQATETNILRKKPFLVVKNGRFAGNMKVKNGELYMMYLGDTENFKSLCLASGKLEINILGKNLEQVAFYGNKTTMAYDSYRKDLDQSKQSKDFGKARSAWINARIARDTALINSTSKKQDTLGRLFGQFTATVIRSHFKNHPGSNINAVILDQNKSLFSESEVKKIFNTFPKHAIHNSHGDNLKFVIDSLFIGAYAPNFTQLDTAGNPVSLSSFKGEYLLIDFWASWCVPCRKDNPNLVSAKQIYGEKKFNIIGVSLDEDGKSWREAIKADGLNWQHVSDLKKYENTVSISYDVYAIPYNFLLDPTGKIISKNLSGDQLLEKLEEIFQDSKTSKDQN